MVATLSCPRYASCPKNRPATLVVATFGLSALPPLVLGGGQDISFDGVQYASGHFRARSDFNRSLFLLYFLVH